MSSIVVEVDFRMDCSVGRRASTHPRQLIHTSSYTATTCVLSWIQKGSQVLCGLVMFRKIVDASISMHWGQAA